MKRSQLREMSAEIMVGTFMFMILLALGFFTIILSYDNVFRDSHEIQVRFDHVKGLRQGDNVFLRGVMIGRVTDLVVDNDSVLITANLRQPVQMREGYTVSIVASSVLGGQHLALDEGPPQAPVLPDGTELRGRVPGDIMADATEVVGLVRERLEEGELLEKIEAITDNIAHITTTIREGGGVLGALIYNEELTEEMVSTFGSISSFTAQLESGQGTIGRLLSDDELYEEALLTLHEIRAAIDDFRETAPITTFSSIFFGAF